MRQLLTFAGAALVALGTGAVANSFDSRTTKIPGCAPQCLPQHLIEPGNLPAGKYQTRYFFAGQMKLLFAKGWFSGEDSTGEFWAQPKSNPNARVVFWEDVYAVKSSAPGYSQRVGPLRQTSASLLASLQQNPNLTVSKPRSGKIGTIHARVVDIGVSDGAVNDDPQLPGEGLCQLPAVSAVGRALRDRRQVDQPFLSLRRPLRRPEPSLRGRHRGARENGAERIPAHRRQAHRHGARSGVARLSTTGLRLVALDC